MKFYRGGPPEPGSVVAKALELAAKRKALRQEMLMLFRNIADKVKSDDALRASVGWKKGTSADIRVIIDKIYKYIDVLLEEAYNFEYRMAGIIEEVGTMAQGSGISENLLTSFTEIMVQELDKAIKINPEFAHPKFYNPLRRAVENPALYSVSLFTNKKEANVALNEELILGTAEELGSAVTAAREQLNYGDVQEGTQASRSWYMNLYAVAREGRTFYKKDFDKRRRIKVDTDERNFKKEARNKAFYWRIVKARLDFLGQKPAYWVILENGSANVTLSSDKSGIGNPTVTATHFVTKAKRKMQTILKRKVKAAIGDEPVENEEERIRLNRAKILELEAFAKSIDRVALLFERLNGIGILEDRTPLHKKYLKPENAKEIAQSLSEVAGIKTEDERQKRQKIIIDSIDQVINSSILSRKEHLRFLEQADDAAAQDMKARLRLFVVQAATGQKTPYRLYVGTRSNVELRLRTKSVKEDILREIDSLSAQKGLANDLGEIGKALKAYLDLLRETTRKQNLELNRKRK